MTMMIMRVVLMMVVMMMVVVVVVVVVVSIGKRTKAQKLRMINTQGQTKRRSHFSAVP